MYKKTLHQSWSTMSSLFQDKQLSFASWILLLLSGILQFIFSLSHAIALRKLLLLIAFLIAFKFFWEALLKKPKPLLSAVLIFVLLQVWMLVIAGAISNQPFASFSEWKGQWLPAFMSFVVGIGLARTLTLSKLKDPRVVVVMSILIPITIYLCVNAMVIVHDWILAGRFLPNLGGISDHHGISGYLVALLEPILFADMLSRLVKGNRLLPVPGWVISAILIFAVCTLIATTNRNGILIMFLTFILGAAMMISEIRKIYSPKKIITFVLATIVFILAIALVAYKIDPRWQNFIETVPFAWDIDHDFLWLNGDGTNFPLTPSGKQVDISEYSRIAWAHEGWRMLMAHPWGMEIARDTFHKLELAKYGHAGMAHSHNSWIDFGLEVGIPGLLLWGWILLLMAQFGWRTWRTHKEPLGLALAVLAIMFAVRGLLDSIFRDHELEQFMLIAGLLFSILSFGKTNIQQARL
jgi:O-antigen ligase